MISVKLTGGLGNQMFIYAFAKAIEQRGLSVCLSAYDYNKAEYPDSNSSNQTIKESEECRDIRNLEILFFDLSLPLKFCFEERFREKDRPSPAMQIVMRMLKYLRYSLYLKIGKVFYESEPILKNNDFISFINPNSHLIGYFQDLRFFGHIRAKLIEDFKLKRPLLPHNQALKEKIANTPNACFLHIRRGDYLKEECWFFVELGSVYYENAIEILKFHIKQPNFFIFSNDIAWCKENFLQNLTPEVLKGADFHFIDQNGEGNAIEEMELMRTCQHGIIANSTFSWWSAYLMESSSKVIVTPSRFHYYENITEKLIPNDAENGKWIVADFIWRGEV